MASQIFSRASSYVSLWHNIPGVLERKQNPSLSFSTTTENRKTLVLLFTSSLDRFVSPARIKRQTIFFKSSYPFFNQIQMNHAVPSYPGYPGFRVGPASRHAAISCASDSGSSCRWPPARVCSLPVAWSASLSQLPEQEGPDQKQRDGQTGIICLPPAHPQCPEQL